MNRGRTRPPGRRVTGVCAWIALWIGLLGSSGCLGYRLTPAQVGALNNILVANGSSIENFESMRESLELGDAEEEDRESGPLLEALKPVTEWKPPVQRGKRTFDDKAFYESLSKHFEQRGSLSPRQRAALKRMVRRYRDQIPDYRQLAETWGIGETKK